MSLGLTTTDNMGQHIFEIASKTTKTLDFLHRNLSFAPMSTKEAAYKTLVNWSRQHLFGALTLKLRLTKLHL